MRRPSEHQVLLLVVFSHSSGRMAAFLRKRTCLARMEEHGTHSWKESREMKSPSTSAAQLMLFCGHSSMGCYTATQHRH